MYILYIYVYIIDICIYYIYIYIYIYNIYITEEKKHIIYLKLHTFVFFSEALSIWNEISNYKQKYIQITQQHNKSNLKNSYRIKEKIVKGKI